VSAKGPALKLQKKALPRDGEGLKLVRQNSESGTVTDLSPETWDEACAFVARVESLFMPWNIAGLLADFTDDCVVRFGDLPEFRGRRGWKSCSAAAASARRIPAAQGNAGHEKGRPSAMGLT
jgi:hypothetical protein